MLKRGWNEVMLVRAENIAQLKSPGKDVRREVNLPSCSLRLLRHTTGKSSTAASTATRCGDCALGGGAVCLPSDKSAAA